ncbi:enolase C-terminal domain-like protein [Actinomadura livida]|uniref:L-alanine-DL-glutamate epimerase-like enolase superfamily enzyme n=1 Tax=Actinomadura livida TaxID=79909 RepID=A0A7W7ICI9_9ACTN|nr:MULTISPECIES: enolase C-terminal domain-like protein [Actinomadura]MBB4774213.1 L-alanine-DL-glutamate epimerase-like enolase superfamily enzyme [Actinomadura catellatispora]GGT84127.1 mandelate racemase [Actinomadura livida]
MRIIDVREVAVPLHGDIGNSVVNFAEHTVSLVAVRTDVRRNGRPLTGIAFNSIGRHAQGGILRDRMVPRLLAADPGTLLDPATGLLSPARVLGCAMRNEKPGGHGDRAAAAGAVELAVWDLLAKHHDEPAHATIARAFGRTPAVTGVPVYAAGGYYHPDDSLDRLRGELTGYVDQGYPVVKIKIGGVPLPEDMARVEAAVEVMGGGDGVAVDANGRFDRDRALAYATVLSDLGLHWYEEAGDPLDYALHRELTEAYPGAIATGENLFSVQDVRNLLTYGGVRPDRDIFQMDAGLSYGLTEYARMIEAMESHGVDRAQAFPHGGHLINLHVAAGLGLGGCEAYPGVFEPFGGYSPDCRLSGGLVHPGQAPGFGLEAKPGLDGEIADLLKELDA